MGKSGEVYHGKIYCDKNCETAIAGPAIICLTNSRFQEDQWHHRMNSIYMTSQVQAALAYFKVRDDISHMIVISKQSLAFSAVDHVDNLIRQYLQG